MTPRQKAFLKELNKTDAEKGVKLLADGDKRCILGIACEVYIRDSGRDDVKFKTNGVCSWFGQEFKHIPYVVKEYFGFNSVSGEFSEPIQYNRLDYYSLEHLNDDSPVTLQSAYTFIRDNADKIFCKSKDEDVDKLSTKHPRAKKKV